MSYAKRGGQTLTTGKIGRCNVIRQQMLMPGERMNMNISGTVRLEVLRERDVLRVNAHLATFAQPLRWLWPEYPDYVKEGPDTLIVPPSITTTNWDKYGVGSYNVGANGEMFQWFRDAPIACYNNWYRWPEDPPATTWDDDGNIAVPLSHAWSRCRYSATPTDSGDYEIDVSTPTMDVRELSQIQAQFRSAMKREVLSYGRFMETVENVYKGANPSREVDKVPMMLDQTSVGVNPREMPAMDGPSLGQWQSMYDFKVNHGIRGIIAPEHMIVTTILTLRFAPIIEMCAPIANKRLDWYELTADPEYLSSAMPVEVQRRDLQQTASATVLGYLPAGWQWRTSHDVIGERIDTRDSFPYHLGPSTQADAKDATRVKDAFRSQSLGDYMVDLYFQEDCQQPIGTSMDSYFSGMLDDTENMGQTSDEFPKGGKML